MSDEKSAIAGQCKGSDEFTEQLAHVLFYFICICPYIKCRMVRET